MRTTAIRVFQHGVSIELHVQPGARRNEVIGLHGGRLKVKIAAPPIEGAANRAVCEFIAELFGVSRANVKVERGLQSRHKCIVVSGTTSLPASIDSLIDSR